MQHATRELLARYLNAVEGYLPRAQSADIIAELSDSIQSQMEEREAELGRPLDLDEQSALLKTYGPPALAASRYLPARPLIGPVLLPYYWRTLKLVILFALAVDLIALLTGVLSRGNALEAFARVWGTGWVSFFIIIGVVTTVFACIERFASGDALIRNWNPQTLPKVSLRPVRRSSSLVELILNVVFVFWLLGVPFVRTAFSSVLLSLGAASLYALPFRLAPAWQWGVVALIVASSAHAVINAINLVRPDWARLRSATFAVTSALIFGVALFIMQSRPLVALADPAQAAQYGDVAKTLDEVALWCLGTLAVTCLISAFVYVRSFVRLSADETVAANRLGATAL